MQDAMQPIRGPIAILPGYSGPLRYDCVTPGEEAGADESVALRCSLQGRWVYHRDGREMMTQLDQEMQQLIGASPQLSSEPWWEKNITFPWTPAGLFKCQQSLHGLCLSWVGVRIKLWSQSVGPILRGY